MKRVLVTGTTGFVGRALCEEFARSGYIVRGALRTARELPHNIERALVGEINAVTKWGSALDGVDIVVHAAARAHVLNDSPENARLYMETNCAGTEQLARAAAHARVRRFVFISSIKVNGEEDAGHAYAASDEPRPQDAYGASKRIAEQKLREISSSTGMEHVIVRPPLVYGPGVRANFLRLMQIVDRQLPLPLGSVDNRRSFVGLWNLTDLLRHVLELPGAANATWMISDGADFSTPQLLREIARAMGRKSRVFPFPVGLLKVAAIALGRKAEFARVCGSLLVDLTETRARLGWTPPFSSEDCIRRTVEWYLALSRVRDERHR